MDAGEKKQALSVWSFVTDSEMPGLIVEFDVYYWRDQQYWLTQLD